MTVNLPPILALPIITVWAVVRYFRTTPHRGTFRLANCNVWTF